MVMLMIYTLSITMKIVSKALGNATSIIITTVVIIIITLDMKVSMRLRVMILYLKKLILLITQVYYY
jgi:hypothetical protein